MSTQPKRHRARGAANYRGDHRHVIGQVMGPTTYGAYLVAEVADHDAETDTTRVLFGHATTADIEATS